MESQKILLIDGNYFMMRVLGQVNMGDSVNNVESETEQKSFLISLKNSLVNLWNTFHNEQYQLVDQIVFVSDCGSWRKDVTPFRPYYLKDDKEKLIGYKEQRIAKKEESPINYDNVYRIYDEFIEIIRSVVPVLKINKLEGDDEVLLVKQKIKNNPNVFCVLFASDGDLEQVITNNLVMMKNIRSKMAPNGEYVINMHTYEKVFEQNAMNSLLGNSYDTKYYKDLFSVQIGCIDGMNKVNRDLNRGIAIATPFRTALVKSVAGDKKDNIFSLISWKSSTGTRTYSLTEKYIAKALEQHGYSLTESNCQKILSSKETIYNLLLSLREVTKQEKVDINELAQHLKHNLKMNVLSVKNIPEELVAEFEKTWTELEQFILHEKLDEQKLKALASTPINPKSSGVNVLAESIPIEEL